MTQPTGSDPLNTQFPNASRIYDYTLGGNVHYEADRQAAEFMFSLVPSTKKWVRMLRASLQEAAQRFWETGLTHYVDFASGLPNQDHIHQVLPNEARIVYSDIDPVTITHAREMVGNLDNVMYLQNDVRNVLGVLEDPQVTQFLDGQRKVAIILNGITVFLSKEEIQKVFYDLYEWAAPGSKIYITYETKEEGKMTPKMQQFLDVFAQTGSPFYLYSLKESIEMSKPWTVTGEEIIPVSEFLNLPDDYLTEADREGVGLEFYAAVLEK